MSDADYASRLDAGQLARIKAVFSTGVCDWTKPGIGQQDAVAPLTFRSVTVDLPAFYNGGFDPNRGSCFHQWLP